MWHAKNVSCLWRSRPENTQVRRRERVAASQVSPRCPSPLPSLLRAWSRGALLVAPVAGSVGGCGAAPWSRSIPPRAIPRSGLGARRAGGTGHPRRRAARDIPSGVWCSDGSSRCASSHPSCPASSSTLRITLRYLPVSRLIALIDCFILSRRTMSCSSMGDVLLAI